MTWFILIFIFNILNGVVAKINIKVEDGNITLENEILNCALDIANKNFDYRQHTVIFYNDIDVSVLNRFIQNYEGSVIIETKRDSAPPKQVVIIVDSFHSFAKLIVKLKPDLRGKTLLSSGAKFLILILSNHKRMDKITHFLWTYYVLNVVIVANDRKNKTALYTYYPYRDHLHCQNTQLNLIAYYKKMPPDIDIYPDKMQNMRGCPLYIATNKLYHPNTEQKIPLQIIKKAIVRLLRDIMNFTPIISTKDYISIESDRAKNWSDSLSDIITGINNISMSSIPLGVDRMGFLDYSIPYFSVRLAWIAPPISPGPVWWRLVSPLNGYLGIFLMSIIFFVKFLPFFSKLNPVKQFCRRYFKNFDKVHGVALRSWGVMMGQPMRLAPRRFRDFYVISLWMWFTFVVRSAYQSVLIVALKTDTVKGKYTSLSEAVDNGLKFGGRRGIFSHFEHDAYIRDGFQIVPEERFDDVFRDVVEGKTNFVIATSLEYAWAYCLAQGKKEDTCGYLIPDSIMTVPLVMWMKNYSPFIKPISVWLPRLIESGLLDREIVLNPTFLTIRSSDATALNWEQTASCLVCLLIGTAMSTVVFIFEVLRYKSVKYTRNGDHIQFTN